MSGGVQERHCLLLPVFVQERIVSRVPRGEGRCHLSSSLGMANMAFIISVTPGGIGYCLVSVGMADRAPLVCLLSGPRFVQGSDA